MILGPFLEVAGTSIVHTGSSVKGGFEGASWMIPPVSSRLTSAVLCYSRKIYIKLI